MIDLTTISFNGEEIRGFNEAVFESVFSNPKFSELHTVIPGIKAQKQIVLIGLLGLTGKVNEDCEPDVNPNKVQTSQKKWDPAYIEDRFVECWKDLAKKFTTWALKNGIEKPDLTGTDFALFIEEVIAPAIIDAIYRIIYFGDINHENVADGGVIVNGTDVDYFNSIDGYWAQIFDMVAADANKRVAVTRNDGASYALQAFTAQDITDQVVTNIFRKMIAQADERLIDQADVRFVVTKSMADQYKAERLSFNNIEVAYTRTEAGYNTFMFDGIPVYVLSIQDRIIKAYMKNGTKYNLPHRGILTTTGNAQIGTEEESSMTELDMFHDKKSKSLFVDYGFNLDAKLVEDYKVVAAY